MKTELGKAMQTWALSRTGVYDVAFFGSNRYQNKAQLIVDELPFAHKPRGGGAVATRVELPLEEEGYAVAGYDGLRVTSISSETSGSVHDIRTIFSVGDHRQDEHVIQVKTTGEATLEDVVVNTVPEGRLKGQTRAERVSEVKRRTAAGLLIAEFTIAAIEQTYGIYGVPTDKLNEAKERLTANVPLKELVKDSPLAVLLPQRS